MAYDHERNQRTLDSLLSQIAGAYNDADVDMGPTLNEKRAEKGRNMKYGEKIGGALMGPGGKYMGQALGSQWGEDSPIGGGKVGDRLSDIAPGLGSYAGNFANQMDMPGGMGMAGMSNAFMPLAVASNWDQLRRFAKEPDERIKRGYEKGKEGWDEVRGQASDFADKLNPTKW